MDFLSIRKKAKEQRAGRADAVALPRAAGALAPVSPVAPSSQGSPEDPSAATPRPLEKTFDKQARRPDDREDPSGHDFEGSPAKEIERALVARLSGTPTGDGRFLNYRPETNRGGSAPPPTASAPSESVLVRESAERPPAETFVSPEKKPESRDLLEEFFYRPDEETPELPGYETMAPLEPARPAEGDVRQEYITFLLGEEEYAVAIERVREVLRCPPLTEVPRAPFHVRGVVSVRGEVVAVVEPRRRLALPERSGGLEHARLLVVDVGLGPVGLLVDAVSSVVRLLPGSIEPCPNGIGGASQEYLAGIGRIRDRLFTVLDLGALLRRSTPPKAQAEGSARAV